MPSVAGKVLYPVLSSPAGCENMKWAVRYPCWLCGPWRQQMTTKEIGVQRFSVTSSKSFGDVVTAFEEAVGHPDMNAFRKSISSAKTFADMEQPYTMRSDRQSLWSSLVSTSARSWQSSAERKHQRRPIKMVASRCAYQNTMAFGLYPTTLSSRPPLLLPIITNEMLN